MMYIAIELSTKTIAFSTDSPDSFSQNPNYKLVVQPEDYDGYNYYVDDQLELVRIPDRPSEGSWYWDYVTKTWIEIVITPVELPPPPPTPTPLSLHPLKPKLFQHLYSLDPILSTAIELTLYYLENDQVNYDSTLANLTNLVNQLPDSTAG